MKAENRSIPFGKERFVSFIRLNVTAPCIRMNVHGWNYFIVSTKDVLSYQNYDGLSLSLFNYNLSELTSYDYASLKMPLPSLYYHRIQGIR